MNANETHHGCPDQPHTHPLPRPFMFVTGHWCSFEGDLIVTCNRTIAERIAVLLDRHGLIDIPDTIPVEHMWAPPHPDDVVIDLRMDTLHPETGR